MPQSSSRPDVFSPRRRLPLDPFAGVDGQGAVRENLRERWKRTVWEVDLERSGVHRSRVLQRVILVLGEPQPSDILPLITSPHLAHSLVLIATHSPRSLAIPAPAPATATLPPGPAVRVLRLAAPLNVHDAGALRLVNFLERAQRVARLWRYANGNASGKGKGPAASAAADTSTSAGAGAEQRVIQLAQDGPDGEFTLVEPFVFAAGRADDPHLPRGSASPMPINAQCQSQSQSQTQSRSQSQTLSKGNGGDQTLRADESRSSSQLYPSPPPSIASASQTSIANPSPSLTPKKAAAAPQKSRFSLLSLKSPSTTSLRDSYSKQKKLHNVKESVEALENEHALLNHPNAESIQAQQAHTRTFDAVVNFFPQGHIPDKALLKCAILVTTLSAQYLAVPPGAAQDAEIEEEEEQDFDGAEYEHGFASGSEAQSRSLPAHIRTTPTRKVSKSSQSSPSLPTTTTSSTPTSTSPPSAFPSIPSLQSPTEQTPTQKPHRYHYQRRSSTHSSSNGSLPIPPPMSTYPSSSSRSSVASQEPQRRFSMMSVLSGSSPSPSSSSSVSAASRPDLQAHTSSSTGTSTSTLRSSLWAQASSATSLQTTPATSPLPSSGLGGVQSEVDLVKGANEKSVKRRSIKNRFSMIFGGRPEVQWKTPGLEASSDLQRTGSIKPKTTKTRRYPVPLNAHIVHVLPHGWIPPEDAIYSSASQSRRHSLASTSGSQQLHAPSSHLPSSRPHHPHLHTSKPKLVQGIEQFLLSFAVNMQHQNQHGHRHTQSGHVLPPLNPASASEKKLGKRPMTSEGVASSGKAAWSDPGVTITMPRGQLASLVEAEGKREGLRNSLRQRRGRGAVVPFIVGEGVFGKQLTDGEEAAAAMTMTVGELVLLGALDAQSVGRAWVGGGDVALLPSKEETLKPSTAVEEKVTASARVPVPSFNHSSSGSAEVSADVDSVAEEKLQAESDEGAAEMGAPLLPSPPDSQSSSVRSRSQSHSGSGSGGSTEAEAEAEGESAATSEEGGGDDQELLPQPQEGGSKRPTEDASYPVPSLPERVYSSQSQSLSQQRVEPPLMITLTSPTVGSPSPTLSSSHPHADSHAHSQGHRRLASNGSASMSTSVLPLGGGSSAPPPPSSWHGGDLTGDGDEGAPSQKGKGEGVNVNVKVPRAIYVASGSSSVGTGRARSDSRLPLSATSSNSAGEVASSASASSDLNKAGVGNRQLLPEAERRRAKSHGHHDHGYDGFGSALRRLGMGMFGRGGGGGGGAKAKER